MCARERKCRNRPPLTAMRTAAFIKHFYDGNAYILSIKHFPYPGKRPLTIFRRLEHGYDPY